MLAAQIMACLYGFSGILLGAFGAHVLNKKFTPEQMASFETGVKYQMYHAIVLLVLSFNLDFTEQLEGTVILFFGLGTFLFSFSIYGLCFSQASGRQWKWLGPITPLGGLFLAAGWGLLFFVLVQETL